MRIKLVSVAAWVAVASAAPAIDAAVGHVNPNHQHLGRPANVDPTCTPPQLPAIQAAMKNCAEAAKHAALQADGSPLFQTVFGTTDPSSRSMVKTVLANIYKQCATVNGANHPVVQFKCIQENQEQCAPHLHDGKPKALADSKKGLLYLCPAFFQPTKKVTFEGATKEQLSKNGLLLINQLARIAQISGPATRTYSSGLFEKFVQTITDEGRGAASMSRRNAIQDLGRRARECFDLADSIKTRAQSKDLAWYTTMVLKHFGQNSHLAVESVTKTLANVQKECDSKHDSQVAQIKCLHKESKMCQGGQKIATDPKSGLVYLCPSFFTKAVRFGISPTSLSLMDELFRIDKLKKVTGSASSLSNPANYASFVKDFVPQVTLKGDPPRDPASKKQRTKTVHILGNAR